MTPQQLKAFRKKLALTQQQLAQRLKVHLTTVQRYEQGDIEIPYAVELALREIERGDGRSKAGRGEQ